MYVETRISNEPRLELFQRKKEVLKSDFVVAVL